MKFVARDKRGTIEWIAPLRADAGPTVAILNSSGGNIIAAGSAATLDSVNTTLATNAAAGATSLTLTSASGVVVNRPYLISKSGEQSEFVEASRLSSTAFVLKHPLVYSHPTASAFQGTRISFTIPSASTDEQEEHCRAVFTWSVSSVSQPEGVVPFVITRHPLHNPATVTDLRSVSPLLRSKVASTTDWQRMLDDSWDEVLERLWTNGVRPSTIVGTTNLKRLVVYHALALLSEQYRLEDERQIWVERVKECLEVFKATNPKDDDEDGAAEQHEQGAKGGYVYRA